MSQLFVFRRGSVSFDKKGAQVVGTPLLPCGQSEDSSDEEEEREEEEEEEEKAGGMSEWVTITNEYVVQWRFFSFTCEII